MKKFIFATLSLLLAGFLFVACGGDDPQDLPAVHEYLSLRSSMPADGAEVNHDEINVISCKFSAMVAVSSAANITLNGTRLTAQASSNSLDIPVTLQPNTRYTLTIPEGSVHETGNPNRINRAITLTFSTRAGGSAQELPQNGAMAMTRMLGFGWNLGNHFDSYDGGNAAGNYRIEWNRDCPYWDGAIPTEKLYQNLAAAGVKSVRIPVTWGPYQNMTDGHYTIDANYMNTIRRNVIWAKNAGLVVILNTHHDEYWQDAYTASTDKAVNEAIETRIQATWQQIAEAFKDEGSYLILETFNELNHNWKTPTAGELRIQNEWNQLAVDAIRAAGGENATRWISVPSYQASPTYALSSDFRLPTDPAGKLIVAIHCYDPYDFTLRDPLKTTWGTDADKKAITNLLNRVKQKFIDKDIPCYLGEFGCSMHATPQENLIRRYYLQYFCRAAYFAGLAGCIWDNNGLGQGPEHHAYFSHADGQWTNDQQSVVQDMIRALTSTDPDYTLQSIKLE